MEMNATYTTARVLVRPRQVLPVKCICSEAQVFNVDACAVPAQMVNDQAIRDWPVDPFPRIPVCSNQFVLDPNLPIPIWVFRSGPNDAFSVSPCSCDEGCLRA